MANNDAVDINIDTREFSELISDIYDAALTRKWSYLLDKIIDITQSNKAFFFVQKIHQKESLLFEFKANFSYDDKLLANSYAKFTENPLHNITNTAIEGDAINIQDHLNTSTIKETEYYQNIFKPMKSYHCLAGILMRDENYNSAFAINRGEDEEPYSIQDFNLIKLLTPHLSRALHTYKTFQHYRNYTNISKSIIENSSNAVMVCDKNATIILANEYANKIVEDHPCITCDTGKLTINNTAYNKKLLQHINQSILLAKKNIRTQETIVLEGECPSCFITISPLQHGNRHNDINKHCCLISLCFQQTLNWLLIKKSLLLTPKELKLLKAIYNKKKLNELSESFGVTYNTLRTHLQAIFQKANVNSQTELMIKLNVFKN